MSAWHRYDKQWAIIQRITDRYATVKSQSIKREDWQAVTQMLDILRKLQAIYRAKEARRRMRRKLAALRGEVKPAR